MVVYTAITNDDPLVEQPSEARTDDVRFSAFVTRFQPSSTWEILPATHAQADPRLNAIFHKACAHLCFPRDAVTLWIGSDLELCPGTSMLELADRFLGDADIAVFSHEEQHCIYQHAAASIHNFYEARDGIRAQIFRYTREHCPANHGVADCRVILRRNTAAMRQFNDLWWNEVLQTSVVDDISFQYIVWKTGVKLNYFPGSISDKTLFRRKLFSRQPGLV